MKIAAESLHLVETALSRYLERPTLGDMDFAERHRALPLYPGWTGTTYLTTSGQFWFRNCEYNPPRIENDLNEASKIVALVVAAERHPELADLLPVRPVDAMDCEDCGGWGRITVGNATNIVCGRCSGLGWRTAALARTDEGSYPSFRTALERFRSFAKGEGLPDDLVFVSAAQALVVDDRFYVTAGALCPAEGRRAYERAVGCRLGVSIGGLGELPDGRLGVYVYGPTTENEAERLMYPNGLKMTIPERRATVRVIGKARMWLLRLRHGRRGAERTRECFR